MKIDEHDILTKGFCGLCGILAMVAVGFLHDISSSQTKSNENIAVMLSRLDTHEKRIDRIEKIENHRQKP